MTDLVVIATEDAVVGVVTETPVVGVYTEPTPAVVGISNMGPAGPTGRSAYELAVFNGFVGTEEEWLLSLEGADGTDGIDGLDGADGSDGIDGLDGVDGTDGIDGTNGTDGDDGLPGLSAYEIAVEEGFVGDETAWLASLNGTDGVDGTDGADGADGDPGADGPSAYAVAVAEGFVGDEAAWLASLVGADGADGTDGVDGADGDDGASAYEVAVAEGFVGDEAAWLASLVGADGADGTDGVDGTDGADGDTHVPDPTGQPDDKILITASGALVYADVPDSAPVDAGIKIYATVAEVNNEINTGIGTFRASTLGVLIPEDPMSAYLGVDLLIETNHSDDYGGGFYPADNGRMTQKATYSEGYGVFTTWYRYRAWDLDTTSWSAWSAWVSLPLPDRRPYSPALWRSGPALTDDGWANVHTGNTNSEVGPTVLPYIASQQGLIFTDLRNAALRTGHMEIGTAAAAYSGLLDAGPTAIGTSALTAGNPAAVTSTPALANSRVEVTATAAATTAVAGLHIPLGAVSLRRGILFQATFAVTGGLTAATRLLCGLVSTSQVATAMTDIAPSAMTHFIAAGYDSSATHLSGYGRAASGSLSSWASSIAASRTNSAQVIDAKFIIYPNTSSSLTRFMLRSRSTSALVAVEMPSALPYIIGGVASDPVSFFIRASAGGTSAQPKVALLRLRVGAGLELGAG